MKKLTIAVFVFMLFAVNVSFAQQTSPVPMSDQEQILMLRIQNMQLQQQVITQQFQVIQQELPKAQAELKALQDAKAKGVTPTKEEKKDKK